MRYSQYGIAFHKLRLMNVGAQPVFYVSHAAQDDMNTIFKFIQDQTHSATIDPELFRVLHRHFYFMQQLSEGRADAHDTYYYEREWRLGVQSLPTVTEWDRPNPKYQCIEEGYPRYLGRRVVKGDREYFIFSPDDVAFLIAPRAAISSISNPRGFEIFAFEDLVPKKQG
jgi:hypothetical protein